jgi:multiple sugar transport system permease protein
MAGHRDRAGYPRRRRAAHSERVRRGGRGVWCLTLADFTHVTLPLLRPSIQTALILRTVLAFEMFAIVLSIGGRNFPVLVSEAFNWQYNRQDFGVAAAYAVIVMGVSLAATLIYLRVLRTPEEQR